jgi:PAS domain S-box-containing protein
MHHREVCEAIAGVGSSERRRSAETPAEPELQRTFRELIEFMPDAVVIADIEHRVVDANAVACKLLGCGRAELIGQRFPLLAPDEQARYCREVHPLPGLVHRGEWRVGRSDGTSVTVDVTTAVLPCGRILEIARDVTEREIAERARCEAMQWLAAVVEQSPVGLVLVHGSRGHRVELNGRAAQMVGRVPGEAFDEFAKRTGLRTLDGHRARYEALPIVAALRQERTVGAEFLVSNAAGGRTPIAIGAGPIVDTEGAVLGAVAAFQDITAVKELERLRAEWSSVVAHDLRQPLATISLSAEALARTVDDPKVLKNVERIRAAAHRLSRMVGDLMDLSRLEASRLELARQRVDVLGLVRAAAERAELETPSRPFPVLVHGEVAEAYADPDRVAQVLENLLTNAVKYGHAGTAVATTVAQDGGDLAIAVSNEGPALLAAELEHIFERFHRSASARLDGIEGVGLGLYISRSLVEAHGGRITAESTAAGLTTFRFTLPVAGDVT